jgi:hypothetical protein
MRKSPVLLGAAAVAVLLATSAFAANRGVTFTGIGFHPQPGQFPASSVVSMNPQATIFMVNPAFSGNYCIEWTREGGWGTQVGTSQSVCRISEEGTIMANGIYPGSNPAYTSPATWTGVENVWDPIPTQAGFAPCGNPPMSFFDMGGNGDYATGLTWSGCAIARAFRWDKATDTTIQIGTPNGRSTRGNAITADGSSVTGWGTMAQGLRRGAQWTNGTWAWLGDPNGEEPKECIQTGGACTVNSASPTSGCPEFVDDGSCANQGICTSQGTCASRGTCQNRGVCTANVCVGGSNPGTTCTNNNQCRGACAGGTNDGTSCTSDSVCSGACTGGSNDGTVCTSNFVCTGVCVGGTNPGTNCTGASSCTGTCVGPNAGATCNSNSACPDTLVCVNNPAWNANLFKGEAYDVTDDGQHAIGRQICYPDGSCQSNSGYISNPDGSFTEVPPPESFPELVDPFRISQDASTVVGRVGTFFSGTIPFFWNRGMGSQDLQLFLVQQGLDELFFWQLAQVNDVSADGTVIAGVGFNPDGLQEGFIVDMKKLWVCHAPPGSPENARTLGIALETAGDHMAHGDFLGTCEFVNSGGLSRAAELRERLTEGHNASVDPYQFGGKLSSWNGPATVAPPRTTGRAGTKARPKLRVE